MCVSNNDLQCLAQDQSLVSHLTEQIVVPRSQRSSVLARPTYAGSALLAFGQCRDTTVKQPQAFFASSLLSEKSYLPEPSGQLQAWNAIDLNLVAGASL